MTEQTMEALGDSLAARIDERVLMLIKIRLELLRRGRPENWAISIETAGDGKHYRLSDGSESIDLGQSIPAIVRELVPGPYPHNGEPFE